MHWIPVTAVGVRLFQIVPVAYRGKEIVIASASRPTRILTGRFQEYRGVVRIPLVPIIVTEAPLLSMLSKFLKEFMQGTSNPLITNSSDEGCWHPSTGSTSDNSEQM